jgi:hypothetical protein
MEGLRRRRQPPKLPLQREFAGSRLQEQILKQAFELVIPTHRLDRLADDESLKAEAGQPQANPFRSQGA